MLDQSTQLGFRFSKLMAWALAFITVIGFTVLVMGYHTTGALLIVVALIFWLIVRRRETATAAKAAAGE